MDAYLEGKIGDIRRYCLEDALNTYLVSIHFDYLRGNLSQDSLDDEYGLLIDALKASGEQHLTEFARKLEAEPEEEKEDSGAESSGDTDSETECSGDADSDEQPSAPDPQPEEAAREEQATVH